MQIIQNKIFNKEEVCVLSDVHIGVHQDSNIWHNITLEFANRLKTDLTSRNIKDIVICGDLNNNRNEISVQTIDVIGKFFDILSDFNIIITVGNHDAYYRDRSDINSLKLLSRWPNIKVVSSTEIINQFDKNIAFVPWGADIDSIPKVDIMFGHFEISGFKMTKTQIQNHGCPSSNILSKADLVVSGHFHMREERRYGNQTILYLGSPYELNWGEADDSKGYYILDLMSNKFEFVENTFSPKHKNIRLSELLATGITDNVKKSFSNNIVNFVVDENMEQQKIDTLISKLNSLNPLSVNTEFGQTSKAEEVNYEYTGVDIPSAINEFVNMLEIDNKAEVLKYTLDLFNKAV